MIGSANARRCSQLLEHVRRAPRPVRFAAVLVAQRLAASAARALARLPSRRRRQRAASWPMTAASTSSFSQRHGARSVPATTAWSVSCRGSSPRHPDRVDLVAGRR